MNTNVLDYGDNLDILRRYITDASVDLIYLDPPFNSNRDCNVIFRDESGNRSDAQLLPFEDNWHWCRSAESDAWRQNGLMAPQPLLDQAVLHDHGVILDQISNTSRRLDARLTGHARSSAGNARVVEAVQLPTQPHTLAVTNEEAS